jgi:AraC-like DNA-binding protein
MNLAADIGVAELAGQMNLSPHHFSMLFKHALGVPPHQFVLQERIHEAQRQLAAGRIEISELALQLGFSDQSHFSRAFRKMTGTTPKRYRSTAVTCGPLLALFRWPATIKSRGNTVAQGEDHDDVAELRATDRRWVDHHRSTIASLRAKYGFGTDRGCISARQGACEHRGNRT